jgi:nitroreductase
MEAFEALMTRRSVRNFIYQPLPADYVEMMLRAAMHAPSARNRQPWQFVVISDREILKRIPAVHPGAEMAKEASLAFLVCGDETIQPDSRRWGLDCSAASLSILLAAHSIGLGSVWCGVYPDEERQAAMRQLVALPDHLHPFSLIPVGYPAEPLPVEDRFNPEKIHYNQF